MRWRILFYAGAVLILSGCTGKQAPTEVRGVTTKPVNIECRNGVVIHWGANGQPDTTCAPSLRSR